MHIPKERLNVDLSVYLIANRPSFNEENLFFPKILAAVEGGISCVQLRDYQSDFAPTIKTVSRLKSLLKKTPLFTNTLNALALLKATEVDGIYLEEAFDPFFARTLLGPKAIIGCPYKTHLSENSALDYITVKVVSSKRTCSRNDHIWGIECLQKICSLVHHKIVAVGGIMDCLDPKKDVEAIRVSYQYLRRSS